MKSLSFVLSSLSLCLLLFCVILLLLPLQPVVSSAGQPAPQDRGQLFSYSQEQLDTVTISHGSQSFSLVNLGTALALDGMETLPLEQSKVNALLSLLEGFPAGSASYIEEGEPLCTLDIATVDAKLATFCIFKSENYYFIESQGICFSVSPEEILPLLWTKEDYADHSILHSDPVEGQILFSGALHEQPLELSFYIEENELVPFMTSPQSEMLTEQQTAPVLDSLFHLEASEVIALSPSASQLNSVGLSTPFCTIYIDLYGEAVTLSLSEPNRDGTVYLLREDLPILFASNINDLSFLSACSETLTEQNLFPRDYEDTTTLTVNANGKQLRFTKWDGQVLCGGRLVDEEAFYDFYRLATELIPTEAALLPPEDSPPLLSLSFSYTNPAKGSDRVEFYPYDSEQVYLSINGDCSFLCSAELVKEIADTCGELTS